MRVKLVYPTWQRIQYQTHYVLPPLGVSVVAACTPPGVDVSICDENVEPVDFDEPVDLVGIATMLVGQAPRAFAIADEYRRRGVPVVLGGLTVTCLPELSRAHADAIVLGEAEDVWPRVVEDARRGELRREYRREGFVPGPRIAAPRRDLLKRDAYTYRGVRMMDLVETSRGCRFGCFPCQVPFVAGKAHRIRPVDEVVAEIAACESDRVFIVDNALEQNEDHERELFKALKRANKSWVAHPISCTPELLELAYDSGCWYVYHQIHDTSDRIREKVKMMHDHGIAVEATVLLGTDAHGPDTFKRMCDFLLEIDVDLAEFTVLTPFPGTPLFDDMRRQGRLLHEDFGRYNAEHVVFKPARMTPKQLEDGYAYMWDRFYADEPQAARMFRLYRRLADRKGFAPKIGAPEKRLIPNQAAGGGALWGGVTRT